MGRTVKRNYDRYTLAFKLQAIKLANHPNVTAIDIADSLGIHPVMLYRWRMEKKNGTLRENKNMKKKGPPTKKAKKPIDPMLEKDAELLKARKRIKELEKSVAAKQEELDILKKAKRFFAKIKR
jgi:transposase